MNSHRDWLATLSPGVQALAEDWPEAARRILPLMAVFDRPDSSIREVPHGRRVTDWRPRVGIEQEAFAALLAPETRPFLEEWYQDAGEMNPAAQEFRRVLERALGEPLATHLAKSCEPASASDG